MDATAAHMERLLKRARVREEAPADASFLPLSLALACLSRHPPPPLSWMLAGPSSSLLALADPSRTLPEVLDKKLARELSVSGSLSTVEEHTFEAIRALVVYVRTVRGVLAACSSHLTCRMLGGEDEACQEIISVVLRELWPSIERCDGCDDALPSSTPSTSPPNRLETMSTVSSLAVNTEAALPSVIPSVRAVADASGVVKRAVGRDTGNGSAVLDTMDKFSGDERVQTHGVRAIKGVVRSLLLAETKHHDNHHHEESCSEDQADSKVEDPPVRRLVGAAIDRMRAFPSVLSLQRDGLLCLRDVATFASRDERGGVRMVTAFGGIAAIMNALAQLPDDLEANNAGLAVLAHPTIAGSTPWSRSIFISS